MLKITKSRHVSAEFYVEEDGQNVLVKTTTIDFNAEAISTVYDYVSNQDLYSKNRKELRKEEQKLHDLRYEIEDEVLAELDATENSGKE